MIHLHNNINISIVYFFVAFNMFSEIKTNIGRAVSINLKNKYYKVYKINNNVLLHVFIDLDKFESILQNPLYLYPCPCGTIDICLEQIQIDNIIKRILEDNKIKIESFEPIISKTLDMKKSRVTLRNLFNREYIKKFVPNDFSIYLLDLFYKYLHTDHPQYMNMCGSLNYKTNLNDSIYITF